MSSVSQSIPVERLWKLYDYNPLTGLLYSKHTKRALKGSFRNDRDSVSHNYKKTKMYLGYGALVYAWCAGEWAVPTVDHIDQNPRNHRFNNLRPATQREQAQNRKSFNGGANYEPERKKWRSQIRIKGKQVFLGRFSSKAEAQAAYQTALNALS